MPSRRNISTWSSTIAPTIIAPHHWFLLESIWRSHQTIVMDNFSRGERKKSAQMWTAKSHAAVGFPFEMIYKITPHHRYTTSFSGQVFPCQGLKCTTESVRVQRRKSVSRSAGSISARFETHRTIEWCLNLKKRIFLRKKTKIGFDDTKNTF